jgi:hypothetical protein
MESRVVLATTDRLFEAVPFSVKEGELPVLPEEERTVFPDDPPFENGSTPVDAYSSFPTVWRMVLTIRVPFTKVELSIPNEKSTPPQENPPLMPARTLSGTGRAPGDVFSASAACTTIGNSRKRHKNTFATRSRERPGFRLSRERNRRKNLFIEASGAHRQSSQGIPIFANPPS